MNAEQIQESADVTFVYRLDPVDHVPESSLSEKEVLKVAEWARKDALREAASIAESESSHAIAWDSERAQTANRILAAISALAEG